MMRRRLIRVANVISPLQLVLFWICAGGACADLLDETGISMKRKILLTLLFGMFALGAFATYGFALQNEPVYAIAVSIGTASSIALTYFYIKRSQG
jgi:hypothetical protein